MQSDACYTVKRGTGSDNTSWLNAALLAVALALPLSGCTQTAQRAKPVEPPASEPAPVVIKNAHPFELEEVTSDSFDLLLARYRPEHVIVCLWKTTDLDVRSALAEALQWRVQHEGTILLGVNLDDMDNWDAAAAQWLKMAGRARCVVVGEEQVQGVLRLLGLSETPKHASLILLNGSSMPTIPPRTDPQPVTTSKPVSDGVNDQAASQIPPTVDLVTKHRSTPLASQATSAGGLTTLATYTLKLVRVKDGTKVTDLRGTIVWKDLASSGGVSDEGKSLRRLGLGRLGEQVAMKTGPNETVAVCAVQSTGSQKAAGQFAEELTQAVQEAGSTCLPQEKVRQALSAAGATSGSMDPLPASLRTSLPADLAVTGSIRFSPAD